MRHWLSVVEVVFMALAIHDTATDATDADAPRDRKPAAAQQKIDVAPESADIDGVYWYSDGEKHRGLVTIRKIGAIYVARYSLGDTLDYIGVGLRKGDVFVVGWSYAARDASMPPSSLIRGLSTYRITKGELKGSWCSVPGDGRLGTENLIFLSALPKGADDE